MKRVVAYALATLTSWLVAAPWVCAQGVPIGPDFLVGGDPDLSHCPKVGIDTTRWAAKVP